MKYIKLYENIDFDDISEEEFDIHIKKGDILLNNQNITYWYNNKWVSYYNNYIFTIDKVELSDNITGNPYNNYNENFKKIPDNEIIFSIKGIEYWFKYNKNLKIL